MDAKFRASTERAVLCNLTIAATIQLTLKTRSLFNSIAHQAISSLILPYSVKTARSWEVMSLR